MHTPQTIVIIGAGEKGKGIAYGLSSGNFRILLCAHEPASIESFVEGIKKDHPAVEIETSGCTYDATWEADIIVLAVAPSELEEITKNISVVACQKTVIVSANATDVQQLLPNAKVVEAFGDITVGAFYEPQDIKQTIESSISGNDKEAVEQVQELVSAIGFKAVTRPTMNLKTS